MTSFVSVDKKWCVSKAIIAIVSQREVCEIDGSLAPAMRDPVFGGGGGGAMGRREFMFNVLLYDNQLLMNEEALFIYTSIKQSITMNILSQYFIDCLQISLPLVPKSHPVICIAP